MNPQNVVQVNPMATGLFLNGGAPQFGLRRDELLSLPIQTFQLGWSLRRSSTFSSIHLSWNSLRVWYDFPHNVTQYIVGTVSEADKSALIEIRSNVNQTYNTVGALVVSTEDQVKQAIDYQALVFHRAATTSNNGQSPPSHAHSRIECYMPGYNSSVADYLFLDTSLTRVTAVMEGKTTWRVTLEQINEVLNSTFS